MPTGYTAPIAKGITFKEYAMGCARAFGALITMRDDPQNAEIPESFEASNYHKIAIERESAELEELIAMDHATADSKAKESYQKHITHHSESIAISEALAERYKAMLAQVEEYKSPSPDHDKFKEFMASQIKDSIEFDCSSNHHRKELASAKLMSGEEWLEAEKRQLNYSIERHKIEHQKEIDRTNTRNEWVRKLRDSLK